MEVLVNSLPVVWDLDNTVANNILTVDTTREFDVSQATIPLSESVTVIDNGMYDYEPNADYDFSKPEVYAKANRLGIIETDVGYLYDDTTSESIPYTGQVVDSVEVSDDDSTVTIKASAALIVLDNDMYYRGLAYDGLVSNLGMTAYDVILDILTTSPLIKTAGRYNYILGDVNCKTSLTQPLFTPYSIAGFTLDPALANIKFYTPIPPCTYRQALTMACAYAGAYVFCKRDGSVEITTTLPDAIDYTFDETTVYDRPKRINGQRIKDCALTLTTTWLNPDPYADPEFVETVFYDGVLNLDVAGQPKVFTVTHDAAQGVEPMAVMIDDINWDSELGDPTYDGFWGVYSTEFKVIPMGNKTQVRFRLFGVPLSLITSEMRKTYNDSGESVTIDCPIASDPALAKAMMDRYVDAVSATSYEFTMRDNPALDVGDRCWLKLTSEREFTSWNYVLGRDDCATSLDVPLQRTNYDNLVPVIIQKIKSTFNGGMEATYTVVTDTNPR